MKITGENTSNGRRGTDITQQEEETQVDHVKMEMMPEKVALTEGRHRQELMIQPIDMIYLLTAIWLSPGGRSTVHIYTQTIHRTIRNKQYIEQHNFGRVRAVPRLG